MARKLEVIGDEVEIVCAARIATGKFGGALKNLPAPDLGGVVIKQVVENIGPILLGQIDEIIFGQVLQAGCGQNPARQAATSAGLSQPGAVTINKVCSSSLTAVTVACSKIKAGDAEIVIAGGMESMSQSQYLLERKHKPEQRNFGHKKIDVSLADKNLIDSMLRDGLEDAYGNHPHMGKLADKIAFDHEISRAKQDEFALTSFLRARNSTKMGLFKNEIIPLNIDGKVFNTDEGIRETSLEKLSKLKPAFGENGTITAGNASQLSDGAAAMVLMSKTKTEHLRIQPMAKVIAYADYSLLPQNYPLAPVGAIEKALNQTGLEIKRIDLFEINEAFAVVPLLAMKELGIPHEKVNARGGAIALGHPIGASGARILTTLLYALKQRGGRYGLATACNGGGEAVAIIVENLSY